MAGRSRGEIFGQSRVGQGTENDGRAVFQSLRVLVAWTHCHGGDHETSALKISLIGVVIAFEESTRRAGRTKSAAGRRPKPDDRAEHFD